MARMTSFAGTLTLAGAPLPFAETPIIVSDCAGPIPRCNQWGEFDEWGSDSSSGTLVRFSGGKVASVAPIYASTRIKPRAVVSLDYQHLLPYDHTIRGESRVFEKVETDWFSKDDDPGRFRIIVHLRPKLTGAINRIRIASIILFNKSTGARWKRCDLVEKELESDWVNGKSVWEVDDSDRSAFKEWTTFGPRSGRFMSLRFTTKNPILCDRYDWDHWWNLEVGCRTRYGVHDWGIQKWHVIEMFPTEGYGADPEDERVLEGPSFAWREALQRTNVGGTTKAKYLPSLPRP